MEWDLSKDQNRIRSQWGAELEEGIYQEEAPRQDRV